MEPSEICLRDYRINTILTQASEPQAVIVSSSRRDAYQTIAAEVQARIAQLSGVHLPIVDAEHVSTQHVLSRQNAIVLGNLVSSKFVERLYWQWYTLLDLWYPGPGGYLVRSLHDPYGTGHNVIFLGGSDDEGVAQAARVFCDHLQPAEPLWVGYLAHIQLGRGHEMPPNGEWVDPRLRLLAAHLRTPSGYSEASRAGLIYFYNGDTQYAKRFRDLALQTEILYGTDHYKAHMHAIIWDLIEESPFFSLEERYQITERLLRHARGRDGSAGIERLLHCTAKGLHDRHLAMQANCTLTDSRYFGKYWPSDEWKRNLDAVRAYFDRQMTMCKGDSDLGGRGIYSYLESVLIPALLLGDERLITSGALEHYAELCLMHCDNTGYMPNTGQSEYTSYPTYTLQKCAALLGNGQLLATTHLRERAEKKAGFTDTTEEFTAGQAWATGLRPESSMEKMVGVYYLPLASWEHRQRGSAVPFEKSFDKLTMRSGFEHHDQYLLLDGLHGGPDSKPWPDVNSIAHFTQNDRIFLVSDIGGENPVCHNVVTVCKEGLGAPLGRVASLEAVANLSGFGYSHSRANQHAFSSWDRHIFWRKGAWFVVLDAVRITENGHYSLECQWRTIGEPQITGSHFSSTVWEQAQPDAPRDVFHIKNAEGFPLRYSEQTVGLFGPPDTMPWRSYCSRPGINRVRQIVDSKMQAGDVQVFTNLLYVEGSDTTAHYEVIKIADTLCVLCGDELAYMGLIGLEGFRRANLRLMGSAFCAGADSIAVVNCREIAIGTSKVITTSVPCHVELIPSTGEVAVEAMEPVEVQIDHSCHRLSAGRHELASTAVLPRDMELLRQQICQDAQRPVPRSTPDTSSALAALMPAWSSSIDGVPLSTYAADIDADGCTETVIGLACGGVLCLDAQGQMRWRIQAPAAVRALSHIPGKLLVGCDDEHLYALHPDNGKLIWQHRCRMPETIYSWWTTELKAKVQAILTEDVDNDGQSEIICGTGGGCVELIGADGQPRWLRQIEWGIPDRLRAMKMPDGSKTILVSNGYSSSGSTVWRLDAKGNVLSRNAFDNERGSWDMTAVPGLEIVDLSSDGCQQAIIGRKNAYNEVALHDAVTGDRKWLRLLGDWISALATLDVNADGVQEIIVGSPSAWLTAFDFSGAQLWAVQLPHEIRAMHALGQRLLVACTDRSVYEVGVDGSLLARCVLKGMPLSSFAGHADTVTIADDAGGVTCFQVSAP
jgi:hypothetical protein